MALFLITSWACYMLVTMGNLIPSDNYILYTLSVLSIMYVVINLTILLIDKSNR